MMGNVLLDQLDYVFFFYGLSFISLSLVSYIQSKKSLRLSWGWLGLFGLMHGINEWLDLIAFSWGDGTVFSACRWAIMTTSFLFLLEFGRISLNRLRGRGPGRWMSGLLLLAAMSGGLVGWKELNITTRYFLGLVGGLWAGLALFWESRNIAALSRSSLFSSAIGMLLYGLAAGLIVPQASFFPASMINYETFLQLTGIPVQLIRGLLAFWITAMIIAYCESSWPVEYKRSHPYFSRYLYFTGIILTAILISGWFFTNFLGNLARDQLIKDRNDSSQIIVDRLVAKLKRAEDAAKALSGSPWIGPALWQGDLVSIEQANSVLDRYKDNFDISVAYLLDKTGKTIASSNRQDQDSFVGHSYAFRPYFQQALRGKPGRDFAMGITSHKPGFYASYPIKGQSGQVVGVVVLKIDLEQFSQHLRAIDPAFLIEAGGMVFLASRTDLAFKSLWPLPPKGQTATMPPNGKNQLPAILVRQPQDGEMVKFADKQYLVCRRNITSSIAQGWSLVSLVTCNLIVIYRLSGIFAVFFLVMLFLVFIVSNLFIKEKANQSLASEARFRKLNRLQEDLLDSMGVIAKLKRITDGLVEIFDADFARIWLIKPGDLCNAGCFHDGATEGIHVCTYRERCLHLLASSGSYQHTDSKMRSRIPIGCYKIGRLATGEEDKFLTNNVTHEDFILDPEWAQSLGLVSCAGYRILSPQGNTIGVMALFSKYAMSPEADAMLEGIANTTSQLIQMAKAEEALKESESRFRTLIEFIPGVAIQGYGTDGIVQYWNKASEQTYGYSAAEALGKSLEDLIIPPEIKPEFVKALEIGAKAEKSGELMPPGEYKLLHKDGSLIPVYSIRFVVCLEGHPPLMFGIDVDLSERKKMEEERLRISKLESLGVLAGGIAHDLNNLLTTMLGNIDLATSEFQSEGDKQERLFKAEEACLQAKALAQRLLTFAKGGAPIKKPHSIVDLVKKSVHLVFSGSKSRCESSFPDNLWLVEVDEGQINQVLGNLLINADQAMPKGGIIKITAENVSVFEGDVLELPQKGTMPMLSGKYIKITVVDSGSGIPPEYLDKIFDPYFSTKSQSSGLGLATAYSIVKSHRGYVTVNSQLGHGTAFQVFLPAKEGCFLSEKASQELPTRGKGKILIMDDEEDIRDVMRRMLEKIGYEVVATRDGMEAIDLYKKATDVGQPFTAAIFDLTVPGGMGGKEAQERLLKFDPEIKAIVSSGYSDDPVMADFEKYGFRGVVAKPYKISEISKVLHNVVIGKTKECL